MRVGKTIAAALEPGEEFAARIVEVCRAVAESPDETRHAQYEKTVDHAREVGAHLRLDAGPHDRVRAVRPTESVASMDYRTNAWEPVTYGLTQKILNYLHRIFSPALTSISYPREEPRNIEPGEDAKTYLGQNLPQYKSLGGYMRRHFLPRLMGDPNGWVAIVSRNCVDELSPDELTQPYPVFVPSANVIDHGEGPAGPWLFVLSDEKSTVKSGKEEAEEGLVFWLFGGGETRRVYQVGKKADLNFGVKTWDRWEAPGIPAMQIGGIPAADDGLFIAERQGLRWNSHLAPALPYLNKLVALVSDIDAMTVLHMYLQAVEIEEPCATCDGAGQIKDAAGGDFMLACPRCDGAGVEKSSLFDRYFVKGDPSGKLPETKKYIDVPTGVIDWVTQREETFIRRAFAAMNMDFLVRPQTATALGQTAQSKLIDRDGLAATLENVAADVFRVAQFLADWIVRLRYGFAVERLEDYRVVFHPPIRFDTAREGDLMANIREQVAAGQHVPAYIQALYVEAAKRQFGEESEQFYRIRAAVLVDPLFARDEGAVAAGVQQGTISPVAAYIHENCLALLDELAANDVEFLLAGAEEQREAVEMLARQKLPAPVGSPQPTEPQPLETN